MSTATVTSKGQITIPKEVRERLGLRAGHQIRFEFADDGTLIVRPKTVALMSLAGSLKRPGKGATLEDIEEGVRQGAAASFRRSLK